MICSDPQNETPWELLSTAWGKTEGKEWVIVKQGSVLKGGAGKCKASRGTKMLSTEVHKRFPNHGILSSALSRRAL